MDWFLDWWRRDRPLVSGVDLALSSNIACLLTSIQSYARSSQIVMFRVAMRERKPALKAMTLKRFETGRLCMHGGIPLIIPDNRRKYLLLFPMLIFTNVRSGLAATPPRSQADRHSSPFCRCS